MMGNLIYVYLDGDGIGNRLELLLLDEKIAEAKEFSNSIHESIKSICAQINSISGVELVFAGGDDIVIICKKEFWDIRILHSFQDEFNMKTGCSMSAGVGNSIQEALLNLRRAKLSGKNKTISHL